MDEDENYSLSNGYDFDKVNRDRDSVDTLELIKDSSDLSIENSDHQQENYDEIIDQDKNDNDDEGDYDDNDDTKTIYNEIINYEKDDDRAEKNDTSAKSSISSINIENRLKPISIDDNTLPDYSKKFTYQEEEIDTSDLNHLEPKLRDAWIQMRKLDKKLAQVSKHERKIKRETIALIEKNRAELELLRITSDHKETKLEAENTAHFLALSYVDLDDDLDKEINSKYPEILTPLFKTQLPDIEENSRLENHKNQTQRSNNESINSTKRSDTDSTSNKTNNSKHNSSATKSKISNNSNQKEKDKNFIKRNIKLAQDAGGILAMTEEEKQRLNELLLDTDDFESDKDRSQLENNKTGDASTFVVEYNPNAVSLAEGDGFTPNKDEMEKLKRINTALEKRNYSRITNSRVSGMTSQMNTNVIDAELYDGILLSEKKQIKLNDDFDENEFGDKFIREARLSREQEARLKYVDTQLEKLKIINFQEQSDITSAFDSRPDSVVSIISQEQLRQLIDEYYSENSQNILENGNKELRKLETLNEEVVQTLEEDNNDLNSLPVVNENLIRKLLDEAKEEGLFQITPSRSATEASTERSYYEEALEIINARKNLVFTNFESDEQNVPVDENEKNISIDNENKLRTSQSLKSLNEMNQFINDEKVIINNKLPPLLNKSNENYEMSREESRLSSASSVSLLNNNNTTVFPKIDSRFLPK